MKPAFIVWDVWRQCSRMKNNIDTLSEYKFGKNCDLVNY